VYSVGQSTQTSPRKPAEDAFDGYAPDLEARLSRRHSSPNAYIVVVVPGAATGRDAQRELMPGAVRVEPVNSRTWPVKSSGLSHHWRAAAFVPYASPTDILMVLRDYSNLSRYYTPEVISSTALAAHGATAVLGMRFRKRPVITIVLDAEFEAQSGLFAEGGYSISRSAHIGRLDQAGTTSERRGAEGADDGSYGI